VTGHTNSVAIARRVIEELNRLQIPYMVVGSLSSNFYAIPRSTQDADFVIESDQQLRDLRQRLSPSFKMDDQIGFETKFMTTKFVFTHQDTPFKVEVFLLSSDEHDQMRFHRRLRREDQGLTVYIPTPEDVIVQKLRWARQKDLQDVRDILDVQGEENLDLAYIHGWCDRRGSRETLERVRAMPFE
jgi:predicted SPOUT superfamily RNA methylase MTH1